MILKNFKREEMMPMPVVFIPTTRKTVLGTLKRLNH
jgi:hypothetical protein